MHISGLYLQIKLKEIIEKQLVPGAGFKRFRNFNIQIPIFPIPSKDVHYRHAVDVNTRDGSTISRSNRTRAHVHKQSNFSIIFIFIFKNY